VLGGFFAILYSMNNNNIENIYTLRAIETWADLSLFWEARSALGLTDTQALKLQELVLTKINSIKADAARYVQNEPLFKS